MLKITVYTSTLSEETIKRAMATMGGDADALEEVQFIPAKNLTGIKVEKSAFDALNIDCINRILVPKGIDIEFCGETFHKTLTVALVDGDKVIEEQKVIICFDDDEFISRINTMGLKSKGRGGEIKTRNLIVHKLKRRRWKKEKSGISFFSRLIG